MVLVRPDVAQLRELACFVDSIMVDAVKAWGLRRVQRQVAD